MQGSLSFSHGDSDDDELNLLSNLSEEEQALAISNCEEEFATTKLKEKSWKRPSF